MAAGDTTNGFIASFDELDAALTAASVTLAGAPGEIQFIVHGSQMIEWLYIEQA
jgi:hypothetical protein